MSESARTKVAILGGGVGAMVAAFELTDTPADRERFEVTVHQLGWRLGGKGASGRNAALGERIEEHGLHVWFGFYDNAFNVMRRCYEELGRPDDAPLATLSDAFKPVDHIVLCDRVDGAWVAHDVPVPPNPLPPGGDHVLPTFGEIARDAIGGLHGWWERLRGRVPAGASGAAADEVHASRARAWLHARGVQLEHLEGATHLHLAHRIAEVATSGPARKIEADALRLMARLAAEFRSWLWKHAVPHLESNPEGRFFLTTFDLATSILVGVVDDDLLDRGFDAVDDEEFCAWIARHGATSLTLGPEPAQMSPMLRSLYDVSFAFEGGDLAKPNMAAGRVVAVLLRLGFTYHGALYFKMQAGMGDTVFGPFYEVLRRRGVRFRFFNDVQALHLSSDRTRIESIDVHVQARLATADYEPLRDVLGLPCWPGEPLWEQLELDDPPPPAAAFEATGTLRQGGIETLRLGTEFDVVVLAISVAALPPICAELIADPDNEPFRRMLSTSRTVRTQAFQLWVNEPIDAGLGWRDNRDAIVGSFVEPMDTYCPMDQLLPREDWGPDDHVAGIGYFCGVLDDREGETAEDALERVRGAARAYVEGDLAHLWPGIVDVSGPRWAVLVDQTGGAGEARLDAQYFRANTEPTERYVLTPAGSVAHRLRADQSGYANLVLAGDWVRNGLDSGCVEGATMAGMHAAAAVLGRPLRIVGDTDDWLRGERRPT